MIICIPTYGHPHCIGFAEYIDDKIDVKGYVGGMYELVELEYLPSTRKAVLFQRNTWKLLSSLMNLDSAVLLCHELGKSCCDSNVAFLPDSWYGNMILAVDAEEVTHRAKEELIRASAHEDNIYTKRFLK